MWLHFGFWSVVLLIILSMIFIKPKSGAKELEDGLIYRMVFAIAYPLMWLFFLPVKLRADRDKHDCDKED